MSTETAIRTECYNLGWADCTKRKVEPLQEQRDSLLAALEALCDKLDQVAKDTAGVFTLAHIHGQNYTGANWGDEYLQARAAIKGAKL